MKKILLNRYITIFFIYTVYFFFVKIKLIILFYMYKYVMIIDDVSKDYIYNGTVNFQTKLASWIDTSKIDIHDLSSNPNAIEVLKNNLGNVDFNLLQENPYYIEIVKYVYNNNLKYKKYIKDSTIERHPDAVEFLKMNPKIKNDSIFENPNPDAIDLISCAIIELIDWNILSNNEYIIKKMEYLHDKSARFSTYSQSYIYDNERQIIKTLYSQINYVDLINILQDKQIIKYLEVYCDIFDSLATNPNFIYVMIYLYNNTKNIYLDSILKNPNFVEFYNNIDLDY